MSITAPRPVEPAERAQLAADSQPLTLVVENAVTNGVRPLTYAFEVASDAEFTAKVFAQAGVAPGQGRTSVRLPQALAADRSYYWRARAEDGANASDHSAASTFRVFTPVVIGVPGILAPADGATVSSRRPAMEVSAASVSGPASLIYYLFEVATDPGMNQRIASAEVPQGNGRTTFAVQQDLAFGTRFYWRVRAIDQANLGPWTAVRSFVTPAAPAPAPVPPPGPLPPAGGSGFPSEAEGVAMILAVTNDLRQRGISTAGDCGAFEITKRVAWAFRNRGAGLEYKPGGRRCEDRSIDIIFFNDGTSVDMLVGAGVDNGPSWQVHPPFPGWQTNWVPAHDPER